MRKILNVLFLTLIVFSLMIPIKVEAASASASGPSSMTVGETGAIRVRTNAPGGFIQGNIKVEGNSVSVGKSGDVMEFVDADDVKSSPQLNINLTAKSPGKTVVTLNLNGGDIDDNPYTLNKTFVINVTQGQSQTQTQSKPSAPQKSEEQLRREAEERRKAEEEAKKREEEKKKEEAQKTPLFSSFDIISKSDKRFDEILDTVPTKFNVFEYSYQLPKNIDSFRLDFEKVSDDVKLEYEAEHKFSKDQTEIVVPVKAQKGEISQSFKITVKKDNTPTIKREVDGKELTVFDDDGLDGFLEGYDFKRKTHGKGKDQVFYYEKGQLRIQLLINDQFDGQWYLVDEKGEIIRPVTAFFLEKDLLVSFKAPEEYHSKTINEEKYEQRNMESSRRYFEIHNNLDVVQNYFSWLVEGGEIVYGMDSSGEEGFYFVSSLKDDVYQVEKAFVGFDNIDGRTQKLAMVSGFGFLGLASTNIVSYLKKRRRS